ncbi:glutathione S-transferase 3, mitochondrial-like [Tubulanus polymorphus]|uniref:glutathione S-transferase 3, mitochondrial-like n=1 Tax=Tubulanus polymorphus TaxID=672921 RepID=UPI003DA36375
MAPCFSKSACYDILPPGYGCVIMTGVGSLFLNMYFAQKVMKARKDFDVAYPTMYTDNNEFNCIQRAHQNYIENYPQFLMLLFIGGLQFPRLTAAAGSLYLVGRVFYARGYSTGDPQKRYQGAFGYIGLLVMLGNTICAACHMLPKCEKPQLPWRN